MNRLCLFYKVVYGLVVVVFLLNIQPVVRHSRCIRMNFRQLHTGKDSFFPLAIFQCIWCCLSWSWSWVNQDKSMNASAFQTLSSTNACFSLILEVLTRPLPFSVRGNTSNQPKPSQSHPKTRQTKTSTSTPYPIPYPLTTFNKADFCAYALSTNVQKIACTGPNSRALIY